MIASFFKAYSSQTVLACASPFVGAGWHRGAPDPGTPPGNIPAKSVGLLWALANGTWPGALQCRKARARNASSTAPPWHRRMSQRVTEWRDFCAKPYRPCWKIA